MLETRLLKDLSSEMYPLSGNADTASDPFGPSDRYIPFIPIHPIHPDTSYLICYLKFHDEHSSSRVSLLWV